MWILSQDKEILLNSNLFYINKYEENGKTIYLIEAAIDRLESSFVVAEYSTEQKAKYVFNILKERTNNSPKYDMVNLGVYRWPYELPKDDEV